MIEYTTIIKKFGKQGEKTGWTYIDVPAQIAQQLVPGNKKSFRVKGFFDQHAVEGLSLIPIGGGNFIIPLNILTRKSIAKSKGAALVVQLELDESPVLLSEALLECLNDEPAALAYFNKLPASHRKYYSKWIESAKTEATKAKRIAQTVTACANGKHYGEMMRSLKNERDGLLEI